jgi:hypothetical protein
MKEEGGKEKGGQEKRKSIYKIKAMQHNLPTGGRATI